MSSSEPFEQAIAQAPDDPAPYLVYADWLTAQGDPLGELITAQHDGRPELKARIDQLLPQVLGSCARSTPL